MRVLKVSVYLQAMKNIFYTIICCLISLTSLAQSDFDYENPDGRDPREEGMHQDTTKEQRNVPRHRLTWKWVHDGVYREYYPIDTLQDGIQNTNLIFKHSVSNTYLGNFPSPYISDIYILRPRGEDFLPLDRVRDYIFKPEDALDYNTTVPFTQLSYFNGGGRGKTEDWLDVWHIQNILPVWNAGFRYNLISSDGAYSYQKSKTYNFAFFSSYEKDRTAVSMFINQNMGHYNENGGVENLADIRDTSLDAKVVGTRLAMEPNNNVMNFNFKVLAQYNMGNPKEIITPIDSVTIDTTITYPMKFALGIKVEDNRYKFQEETVETNFFDTTYINRQKNADVINNRKYDIDAKFILNEHPKYKYLPGVYAGLKFKYLKYEQRVSLDTMNNIGTSKYTGTYLTAGTFNMDTTTMFNFDIWGSFCFAGEYSADYSLEGKIIQYLNKGRNSSVTIHALLDNQTPNHYYEQYQGNHNQWENSFDNRHAYILKGYYKSERLRTEIGIAINNTKNYIYFDTAAMPRQYNGNLMVFTAWAKQVFRLGRFYFDQKVYYQIVNKDEVLPLPELALHSHNYYQNRFFKDALGFQIGLDLFYNTSFYANAYDPAIMQFYNQEIEKTGNYPKLDVFITLNIKRADLFIKYEHVSEYIGNRNYFSAYTYPINPAKLKFGIRWNFYD